MVVPMGLGDKYVSTGSVSGLVPNVPLPEPVVTQIQDATGCHQVTRSRVNDHDQ